MDVYYQKNVLLVTSFIFLQNFAHLIMLAWLVVWKWMRGEGLCWAVQQLTKSFFCANLCRMSQSNWITHSDTAKIQRGIRTQLVSCCQNGIFFVNDTFIQFFVKCKDKPPFTIAPFLGGPP